MRESLAELIQIRVGEYPPAQIKLIKQVITNAFHHQNNYRIAAKKSKSAALIWSDGLAMAA